jgi:hypothetical protein
MKTVLTKLIERIDMLSEGLDATSDETKIHLIGIKKTAESMLADEKIQCMRDYVNGWESMRKSIANDSYTSPESYYNKAYSNQ